MTIDSAIMKELRCHEWARQKIKTPGTQFIVEMEMGIGVHIRMVSTSDYGSKLGVSRFAAAIMLRCKLHQVIIVHR